LAIAMIVWLAPYPRARPKFAEIAGPDLELFWAHHGTLMHRLGDAAVPG
jgi:hypothetical protein